MAATCTNALVFIIVLFIGTLYNCYDICYFHNLRCCCILREAPASYLMLHKSRLSTSSSRSISTWHKRGHVYLCRPFFMDLTIAMDVESNPGPNWSLDELSPNNRSQISFSSLISIRRLRQAKHIMQIRFVHTQRDVLFIRDKSFFSSTLFLSNQHRTYSPKVLIIVWLSENTEAPEQVKRFGIS